eukprot:3866478-Amphidinium_carterae.1
MQRTELHLDRGGEYEAIAIIEWLWSAWPCTVNKTRNALSLNLTTPTLPSRNQHRQPLLSRHQDHRPFSLPKAHALEPEGVKM